MYRRFEVCGVQVGSTVIDFSVAVRMFSSDPVVAYIQSFLDLGHKHLLSAL